MKIPGDFMKSKYLIYTSFLGFFIVGVSFIMRAFANRKYILLLQFWLRGILLIPFFAIAFLAVIVIETYLFDMYMLKYAMYIFLVSLVYVAGVILMKKFLVWKKEHEDVALVLPTIKR